MNFIVLLISLERFKQRDGKVTKLMTLIWTVITWLFLSIGPGELIFQVSSLFSNAIGALGLPIVPALSVVFFQNKMNGIKAIGMVFSIYHHHLDDCKSQEKVFILITVHKMIISHFLFQCRKIPFSHLGNLNELREFAYKKYPLPRQDFKCADLLIYE